MKEHNKLPDLGKRGEHREQLQLPTTALHNVKSNGSVIYQKKTYKSETVAGNFGNFVSDRNQINTLLTSVI